MSQFLEKFSSRPQRKHAVPRAVLRAPTVPAPRLATFRPESISDEDRPPPDPSPARRTCSAMSCCNSSSRYSYPAFSSLSAAATRGWFYCILCDRSNSLTRPAGHRSHHCLHVLRHLQRGIQGRPARCSSPDEESSAANWIPACAPAVVERNRSSCRSLKQEVSQDTEISPRDGLRR